MMQAPKALATLAGNSRMSLPITVRNEMARSLSMATLTLSYQIPLERG